LNTENKKSTFKKNKIVHNYLIMAAIIICGAGVRILFFKSIGKAIEVSDTTTYYDCAMSIYYHLGLNEYRPPIYPLGIMIMAANYGWANIGYVMPYLQSLLGLLNVFVIYLLVNEAFQNRIIAYISSFIAAISFTIYNWDFILLSENFSIFLVTLAAYCLVLFFNRQRVKFLYYSFIISFLAIYTKPFFLMLPILILIFILLRFFMLKDISLYKLIKPLSLCLAVIYGSIVLYSALHYAQTGYFGFSSVGSVNYLGKVMQYNMGGYVPELKDDIDRFMANEDAGRLVNGKFPEPWHFVGNYGYIGNHYEKAGQYAKAILVRHPFEFIVKSLGQTVELLLKSPFEDYIAINELAISENKSALLVDIKKMTDFFDRAYILVIPAITEMLYLIFFAKKKTKKILFPIVIIVLIILYHYAVAAFFSYGDYPRLIVPAYPLIYIVMVVYPARLVSYVYERIAGPKVELVG